MSATGKAVLIVLALAAVLVGLVLGFGRKVDPSTLPCDELGPYLLHDLEKEWALDTSASQLHRQTESEIIEAFNLKVREALVLQAARGCRQLLPHTASFAELLTERSELGLKPFIKAGFGSIDADLRPLGLKPEPTRAPYAPLPKVSAKASEGDMGSWTFTRVRASIESGWLTLSVNVPVIGVTDSMMGFYFDTQGSGQPDQLLSHPMGPSYMNFQQVKGWSGGGPELTGCADADSTTLIKFSQAPKPYRIKIPMKCLGNPAGLRFSVLSARWDPKAEDFVGLQYFPAKQTFSGWILPN